MAKKIASNKKKSLLWKHFDISEEERRYVNCLLCGTKISRGGEGKKAGTSAMRNHIKFKHAKQFVEIEANKFEPSSSSICSDSVSQNSPKNQQKRRILNESIERKSSWSINDPKSMEFHYLIAEMIALDNEPLSLIERVGFTRFLEKALPRYTLPSRTYIKDKIIPDMYERIHKKIKTNISQASAISITSDIHNNSSYLNFTVHWLSPNFMMQHAVLSTEPFSGSLTEDNIKEKLNLIENVWNIPHSKIHLLVLHDSDVNMVNVAGYQSVGCFIHSLQLVVNDALKSEPEMMETIMAARRVVTHFNRSCSAQEKLKTIQKVINLPDYQPIQDINSTFCMLQCLVEQKLAVSLYVTDSNVINNLTSQQWQLAEQCLKLLNPFEELTKITSSCISEVIPHVATLMRYLKKESTALQTERLANIKNVLKTELKNRFDSISGNKNYFVATLLDPRFKTDFMEVRMADKAKQTILLEILKDNCVESSNSDNESSIKRRKESPENTFWNCFDEVAQENRDNGRIPQKNSVINELDNYLQIARIGRTNDPYVWWFTHSTQFPFLSKLALTYLSAPCSCTYNQRLISEVGNVYDTKRSCLMPVNTEKLLFIRHNLPLVNFKY